MKRILTFCLCISLILAGLVGCQNKKTEEVEPKQPLFSELNTSYGEHNLSFAVEDSVLTVSGKIKESAYQYLIVILNDENDPSNVVKVTNDAFSTTVSLPDDEEEIVVDLYGGQDEYGSFESIMLDFVKLEKTKDGWALIESPVYEHNQSVFSAEKDKSQALNATEQIQSDDEEIKLLAESITAGISDDYQKAKAIHDWVATNIYYDYDALQSGQYGNMDAKNVLATKKGVCEGFANLMAAMLRSQNVPCRIQNGYALGVGTDREWNGTNTNSTESNHAWNEVFLDGRWIIIDATWDTKNKYQNGTFTQGNSIVETYFDTTLEFFSLSHKLLD